MTICVNRPKVGLRPHTRPTKSESVWVRPLRLHVEPAPPGLPMKPWSRQSWGQLCAFSVPLWPLLQPSEASLALPQCYCESQTMSQQGEGHLEVEEWPRTPTIVAATHCRKHLSSHNQWAWIGFSLCHLQAGWPWASPKYAVTARAPCSSTQRALCPVLPISPDCVFVVQQQCLPQIKMALHSPSPPSGSWIRNC